MKKVKSGKRKNLRSSSSSTSPSIWSFGLLPLFLLLVFLLLLVFILLPPFSFRSFTGVRSDSSSSVLSSSEITPNVYNKVLIEKYEEIIRKAQSLAHRYKNLTGDIPSSHSKFPPPQLKQSSPHSITASLIHNFLHSRSTGDGDSSTSHLRVGRVSGSGEDRSSRGDGDPSSGGVEIVTVDPASNIPKDLVIGIAQDTDPKNLAVFCKSLRRYVI